MISKNLSNVHSDIRGEIYHKALELEKNGEKILKLNTGNPAAFGFKMPSSVKQTIVENIESALGYTDVRGMTSSREAIRDYHLSQGVKDISIDDIFISNGVSEGAYMATAAICGQDDEILVPSPCYSLWVNMIRLCGGKAVFYDCVEEEGWQPDVESIKNNISPKTKAILIINPNNPTGAVYSKTTLEQIYALAKEHDLVIFSDEIYDRLVFPEAVHTPTASLGGDVTVVTFGGLSKSHSVCGLRCGWMVVSGEQDKKAKIVSALVVIASIRLCSNTAVQLAIPAALEDTAYTKEMISEGGRLYEQRKAAIDALNKIEGVSVVPNHAAFYLFPKIDTKALGFESDKEFVHELLINKKILVVPGSGFYCKDNDHFRIVALPEKTELKRAIELIGEFIKEKRK